MKQLKAFTLVEVVAVVVLVTILGAIGAWRLSSLRSQAVSVSDGQALATVERMEELADMEGIALTCPDTRNRLLELQQRLAAKQHNYEKFSVSEMTKRVEWDGIAWRAKAR